MHQQNHRHWIAIMGAALVGLSGLASAGQTVYRCGNSYSDAPCAGASTLSFDDSRSPAQKAQTDAATVQTRALAQQMERERLSRENSAMSAGAAAKPLKADKPGQPYSGKAAAPAASKAKAKAKKKPSESEFFTAATAPDKKNKTAGKAPD